MPFWHVDELLLYSRRSTIENSTNDHNLQLAYNSWMAQGRVRALQHTTVQLQPAPFLQKWLPADPTAGQHVGISCLVHQTPRLHLCTLASSHIGVQHCRAAWRTCAVPALLLLLSRGGSATDNDAQLLGVGAGGLEMAGLCKLKQRYVRGVRAPQLPLRQLHLRTSHTHIATLCARVSCEQQGNTAL